MELTYYRVHAFTDRPTGGNPAAVYPLEAWLPERTMRMLAAEHRLSETAFFVPHGRDYELRWFTPVTEVDLCGHGTLAAGHVVLTRLAPERTSVAFQTRGGKLKVTRSASGLAVELPTRPATPMGIEPQHEAMLGVRPQELWGGKNWVAVLESEEQVRDFRPSMSAIAALPCAGLGITAPGRDVDFVSRYFAPNEGIPEDPVTGSLHSTLVPLWAARLGRRTMTARQLSERGGDLSCTLKPGRVELGGGTYLFAEGRVFLP